MVDDTTGAEICMGTCHCRTVRFRVRLLDGLSTARRCDCSYCAMRGAVVVTAPRDGVEILAGADALTLYQFNTMAARHWFCRICGIYTHHQRRSNPDELGVNIACLGISPFDLDEVPVSDGRRHPNDDGDGSLSGTLRFERRR